MPETAPNQLYFGDNLPIMREQLADASVDLIYLDPPFNSNASYNLLFRERSGEQSVAQITAFEDTWQWGHESELAYREVIRTGPAQVGELLSALQSFLGRNDMLAYLTMMSQRLIELRRVLKPTGSIYLHCDPTASHYLKLLMDAAFGSANFQNEIIWHYRKWATGRYAFQKNHDVILFYAKSSGRERIFNQLYMERAPSTLRRFGNARIVSGYDESGRRQPSQVEEQESRGVRQDDVWDIARVAPVKQLFPTQKPDELLRRIITASSDEDSLVLDPFCGCGTSTIQAETLKRRWIGIDITHLAISIIRHRLHDSFGDNLRPYQIIGVPRDVASARALAIESEHDGRYQFEWWALGLVEARPAQERRKGPDAGVDGYINFFDDNSGRPKRIIVQVKSGQVNRSQIATLKGDLEREKAQIALFITLNPPTGPMEQEALAAGFYEPAHFPGQQFPRVQLLTIEELLNGKLAQYPRYAPEPTFRRAPRRRRSQGQQGGF